MTRSLQTLPSIISAGWNKRTLIVNIPDYFGMKGYRKPEVLSVSELIGVRNEVLQMKKVLVIVMLIIAMGLVGCPHSRGHDSDRDREYRNRDRDRDRDNRDHGRDHEHRR